MSRHLILIGLPCSGKTTVGRLAALRLSLPFFDCDACVEETEGLSVPAIFAQKGEAYFRAAERRALRQLCGGTESVIATGGGAVAAEENRLLLKDSGLVVFLDRDLSDIASCLGNRERPLLKKYTLSELSRQRRAWYLDCADAVLTGGTAEELAAQAAGLWRSI